MAPFGGEPCKRSTNKKYINQNIKHNQNGKKNIGLHENNVYCLRFYFELIILFVVLPRSLFNPFCSLHLYRTKFKRQLLIY